jgi:hypothetical protein
MFPIEFVTTAISNRAFDTFWSLVVFIVIFFDFFLAKNEDLSEKMGQNLR